MNQDETILPLGEPPVEPTAPFPSAEADQAIACAEQLPDNPAQSQPTDASGADISAPFAVPELADEPQAELPLGGRIVFEPDAAPEQPAPEQTSRSLPIYMQGRPQPSRKAETPAYEASGIPDASESSPAQADYTPSTAQYFLMQLLLSLPLVGFVMSIIWGLSESGPAHRRNFARANLGMIFIRLICRLLVLALLLSMLSMALQVVSNWFWSSDYYEPYSYYGYDEPDYFEGFDDFAHFFSDFNRYDGPVHRA